MGDQIISNLWLGDIETAQTINFLRQQKIEHIYNVTSKDYPHFDKINYHIIPLSDSDSPREIKRFINIVNQVVDSIHYQLNIGKSVLVHCEMGMQRSPAIIAYYLMKYNDFNADDAIGYIQSIRPKAFKHRVTFLEALYQLDKQYSAGITSLT